FLHDETSGLFRGPFLDLRLPFRPAEARTPIPSTSARRSGHTSTRRAGGAVCFVGTSATPRRSPAAVRRASGARAWSALAPADAAVRRRARRPAALRRPRAPVGAGLRGVVARAAPGLEPDAVHVAGVLRHVVRADRRGGR